MKTEKTQEQLYNRILINFGIGILAYTLLYFLYQKFYMKNWITFTFAGLFIAVAAVFYILSSKKPLKNYAHMFTAFGISLLFTRLSVIVATVVGMEKFIALQEIYWIKKLLQTRIEVIILVCAGAIYLLGMLIYNSVLMVRVGKAEKKDKHKK